MNNNEILISGQYCNGLGAATKTIRLQARALKELGDILSSEALSPSQGVFRGTINMQLSPGTKYLVKKFSLFFPRLDWDKERRYIKKSGENIALIKISSIKVNEQLFADMANSYIYFGLKGGHYRRGNMLEILTPVELPVKPGCSLVISVDRECIEVGQSRWFLVKRKVILKLRKLFRAEDGNWLGLFQKLLIPFKTT